MEIVRKLLLDKRVQILLGCLLLMVILLGIAGWRSGLTISDGKAAWVSVQAYLVRNPWVLFLALVFLPGLPVPTSALLVIAGLVWGKQPVMACTLCLGALVLNLTWTYWLAAGPARQLIGKLLAACQITIPDLPRGDHLKLILILKLTPGIPLFFQNYMLGVLRAPFSLYLSISVLCNGVIGTGILLSSIGIGGGKMMPALTGVSLIAVGVVLTRLVRAWLARRKRTIAGI